MRKTLIGLVAVIALIGISCGGGDEGGGSTGGGATGGGATGASGPAACSEGTAVDLTGDNPFTITIKDLAFDPDCFSAKAISTITIVNEDTVPHTFTIDGTQVDASIEGGQTFNGESTALEPGAYEFHCTIHPAMTGTVFVS